MHEFERGYVFERDLKLTPLAERMQLIFDVGANVGQSAIRFLQEFTDARIVCFEPVTSTFEQLKANTHLHSRIIVENMALGLPGETVALMETVPLSTENRILTTPSPLSDAHIVKVTWGDKYCLDNGINSIDYLKIDTEGYDFNVVRGFASMLAAARITLIELELGMNKANTKHIFYAEVVGFLGALGYEVFGIYEQIREFNGGLPLRRSNFVFLRPG